MKTGQLVMMRRNPLDEQLGESIALGLKLITDTKDVSGMEGTSGLWVKIEGHDDWIDSSYFEDPQPQPKTENVIPIYCGWTFPNK